jgi:hypothetical protein
MRKGRESPALSQAGHRRTMKLHTSVDSSHARANGPAPGEPTGGCTPPLLTRESIEHGKDIFLAHDQHLLAIHNDFGTRVAAENDAVPFADLMGNALPGW